MRFHKLLFILNSFVLADAHN